MAGKKLRDPSKTIPDPRPIMVPEFGAWLTDLRGQLRAKTSRGAIIKRLDGLGLKLDRSTLLQYERGTVSSPDPAILWGLSRIYHVPLADLVGKLVAERTGRPVPASSKPVLVLDDDQRQVADWFGRLTDEMRHAVIVVLEALAPRQIDRHEPDRRQRA